jgi:digeranylgeranylglycerophospholipid reductase
MTTKELSSITQTIVKQTTIHSPNKKIELDIAPNYVIDNIKHCSDLADKAQDRGAEILTEHRYVRNDKDITLKHLKTRKEITKKTDALIGADGPNSMVAKHNGLFGKREFLVGVQAVVKMKDYDDKIHFYPHIGEYSWYCPEGEGRARIGVAARKGAKPLFESFMKKFPGKISEMQGGAIPLYRPRAQLEKKTPNMTVQLIGDAVPLIKNTTGGGIIPGTTAASIYADNPGQYAKKLGPLKRELSIHYMINKAMRKFSDKDWDKLIEQANDENIKKILKETNRDNAYGMAAQLVLRKPSMLAWARKIL